MAAGPHRGRPSPVRREPKEQPNRRPFLRSALIAAAALSTGLAFGQAFPSRPVTLVVPNPPGGLVDTSARLLGDPLTKVIAQPVVIDNRAGGSGNVAYGLVARAPADGYTLLTSYSAYHVGNPSLMAKLPWAQKDFTPVALITVATTVIAVHPSIPANNQQEFIAYRKTNPGPVSYASQGSGSVSHIGTEVFKAQTGTSHGLRIPYRGSGPAVQDVVTW